jgi:hypothetical protein
MKKIILRIVSREREKIELQRQAFREARILYREGGIKALLQKWISEEIKYTVDICNLFHKELLRETGYFQTRVWHIMLFTVMIQVLWFHFFSYVYACFLAPILNTESVMLSAAADLLVFTLVLAPLIIAFLSASYLKTIMFFLLLFCGALLFKLPVHNLIISNFLIML